MPSPSLVLLLPQSETNPKQISEEEKQEFQDKGDSFDARGALQLCSKIKEDQDSGEHKLGHSMIKHQTNGKNETLEELTRNDLMTASVTDGADDVDQMHG
eukprot:15344325-Ditylum_brightwellii.AAC.1